MKSIQPDILVNNRLGLSEEEKLHADGGGGSGDSEVLGDFGSPEHVIVGSEAAVGIQPGHHVEAVGLHER